MLLFSDIKNGACDMNVYYHDQSFGLMSQRMKERLVLVGD
jgi:hypothetical protein